MGFQWHPGQSVAEPECEKCDDDGCASCQYTCACVDVFSDAPLDCPGCEGRGWVADRNEWCDRCGLSGRCPDCDPDTYRDAALDR